MNLLVGLVAAGVFWPMPGNAAEQEIKHVYRVAIDREYAPYEFVDSYGEAQGYTPSLLRAIGKEAAVQFEFIPMAWPEAVAALDAGKVDIINMIRTPERAAQYQFSTPHSRIAQAIFRYRNSHTIIDQASLAGHVIGFQKNDISLAQLANRTDLTRHIVDSKVEGLLHLNLGKIDAFLCAQQACIRAISEYNFQNIELAETDLFPQDFAFAARKGNQPMIELLNLHLAQLRASGQLHALDAEWLQGSLNRPSWLDQNKVKLFVLFGLLLGGIIVILFWNYCLQKLVQARTLNLQESNERLQQIAENIQEVFWMTDPGKGELLYVSKGYEKIWGRTVDSLYAAPKNWLEAVHIEDKQRILQAAMSKQVAGIYNEEYRIVQPDGSIRWIKDKAFPVRNSKGEVYRIAGIAEDITECKKTEQELRIAATAFESQEGMLIADSNNVILRVNQAFTNITGYNAEEVIGKNPRLLSSGRQDANFYAAMWESIHNTGAWNGEIWNRRKNGEIYPEHLTITAVKDSDGIPSNYVATLTDITKSKAAEENINNLAFYDPLTHLPNRRLLLDRLQQALSSRMRTGREGALLFIDMDNFKTLNDTLGHDIGDLLLQQVAERLDSCVREGDTVARLGGDEFVVMLENLSEQALEAAAQTETVGEKILATLNRPYQLATHECRSSPSIGVTLFNDQSQETEDLLRQADIAMYQAKKAGRNTLRFFDPKMQDTINARAALEDELRQALEQQQFHLHYQIQVDNLHRPLGAEALIRWIHPERGAVSPLDFIPLAEEIGLILPIGHWVLETACAQINAWQQGALTRDFVLAVNVSAKQFRQTDFVAQVQASMQRHAINPMLLKLELTESMLLENIEETIASMKALKEIGVRFSLDDFGTGYSSLQYLKRLPLDQIKIDQSFVRDLATDSSDNAIVRTIIAMARSLNLSIIAEGVETKEQRQLLLDKGCTHYQGYLFGRPVPIAEFDELLKQG